MKQAQGAVLPASPTIGDICSLTTDDTMHYCKADGVWTQIAGGGGGGGGTIEYGSCCALTAGLTLWLGNIFPAQVERQFVHFWAHHNYYADCFIDVFEIEDGGVVHNEWLEQKFADSTAFMAFVRANFSETPWNPNTPLYNCYIRVYDIIDPEIPKLDKIYGNNTFYSMLKGKSRYKRTVYTVDGNICNWSQLGPWFEDLCNANIGFGPGHSYSLGDEKALWFSRTQTKMYGMPPSGFSCDIAVNGGRRIWNWGASDFDPIPVVTGYHNSPISGDPLLFCNLSLANWSSFWEFHNGVSTSFLQQMMSHEYSTLALYALQSNADSNHRAILIKPYGIDTVGLNWFNMSDYDLYIFHNRKHSSPIIRGPITGFGMRSMSNDLVWIDKRQWRPPNWGGLRSRPNMNGVGQGRWTTQFFLRSRVDGKVSPLTRAKIVMTQRHHDAPFKFEVR